MNRIITGCLIGLTGLLALPVADAQAGCGEPGWYGVVFAKGAEKERIEATPIHLRQNRPFHFYGNTVRRMHYRGQVMPRPRDMRNATRALIHNR